MNTSDQEFLLDYYKETVSILPEGSLGKYNLRTILNFIIHLDKVDSKTIAADFIFNYLKYIRHITPVKSKAETMHLFNTEIYPKVPIYSRIGFRLYPSLWLLAIMTIIPILVLFLLDARMIWYGILATYIVSYAAMLLYKKWQHMIFGAGW